MVYKGKERRQERGGECHKLINGVISKELGVLYVIIQPLYRRTVLVKVKKSLSCVQH